MACPKCGCKETYEFVEDDLIGLPDDQERCAACGHIFFFCEHADEEDDGRYGDAGNPWKSDIDAQTHTASAGDPGLF